MSNPLDPDLAEQAVGPHHEDEHQRHERGDLLHPAAEHRVEVAAGEVFEHADEQAAEDGAPMLSRPPTITAGSTLNPRMASDPSTPPRIVASRIPPAADTTAAMLHLLAKTRRTEMPIESATC